MKKNKNSLSHTPVLINEAINFLCVNKNCLYVDATFGDGGHSKAILEKNKACKVIAIDRDPDVLDKSRIIEQKYKKRFLVVPTLCSHQGVILMRVIYITWTKRKGKKKKKIQKKFFNKKK